MALTEVQLIAKYPAIPWRRPIMTPALGYTDVRFACRFCLSYHGLKNSDILEMPRTKEDFAKHMAFEHDLFAIFQ